MGKKIDVSLVVSDVDNTILDFFGIWGTSTKKAFKELAKSRHIKYDDLVNDVMTNTHPEYRIHDLPALIKTAPILQPKNNEEKKRFDKDDAKIIHEWQKKRNSNGFYDGVIATVRKIKANGGKFVLYSDAPVSSVVIRLAKRKFPVELIDGIYAQPDVKSSDAVPLKVESVVENYIKELGDKIRPLHNFPHKPQPDALKQIMKDMGIKNPKKAVMVGDNLRSDCGGGNLAGMNSAWQKDGADVCKEAVDFYFEVPTNPNYALGLERANKQLKDPENKPTVILEKGFKELDKYFKFIACDKENLEINKNKMFDARTLMFKQR